MMKVAETTDSLLNEHRENCQIGLSYIKCTALFDINYCHSFGPGEQSNFRVLPSLEKSSLTLHSATAHAMMYVFFSSSRGPQPKPRNRF